MIGANRIVISEQSGHSAAGRDFFEKFLDKSVNVYVNYMIVLRERAALLPMPTMLK